MPPEVYLRFDHPLVWLECHTVPPSLRKPHLWMRRDASFVTHSRVEADPLGELPALASFLEARARNPTSSPTIQATGEAVAALDVVPAVHRELLIGVLAQVGIDLEEGTA